MMAGTAGPYRDTARSLPSRGHSTRSGTAMGPIWRYDYPANFVAHNRGHRPDAPANGRPGSTSVGVPATTTPPPAPSSPATHCQELMERPWSRTRITTRRMTHSTRPIPPGYGQPTTTRSRHHRGRASLRTACPQPTLRLRGCGCRKLDSGTLAVWVGRCGSCGRVEAGCGSAGARGRPVQVAAWYSLVRPPSTWRRRMSIGPALGSPTGWSSGRPHGGSSRVRCGRCWL